MKPTYTDKARTAQKTFCDGNQGIALTCSHNSSSCKPLIDDLTDYLCNAPRTSKTFSGTVNIETLASYNKKDVFIIKNIPNSLNNFPGRDKLPQVILNNHFLLFDFCNKKSLIRTRFSDVMHDGPINGPYRFIQNKETGSIQLINVREFGIGNKIRYGL